MLIGPMMSWKFQLLIIINQNDETLDIILRILYIFVQLFLMYVIDYSSINILLN